MSTETVESSETTPEVTEEQSLTVALDKESVEFNGGGAALVIGALDGLKKSFGARVVKYLATDEELIGQIALAIVSQLRCLFSFNGHADLGGKSVAYQTANRMLIARLIGPNGTPEQATTLRNRLQKRMTRTNNVNGHTLTQGVIEFVIARDSVSLTDAQRQSLTDLRFNGVKSLTDKKVMSVVASVNEVFGTDRRRKSDEPRAQWEKSFNPSNATKPKNTPAASTGDGDNDVALGNLETVNRIAAAVASGNVPAIETVRELFHSMAVLNQSLSINRPPATDAEAIGAFLLHISFMAYGIHAEMFNEDLDGVDLEGYGQAVDAAAAEFAPSEEEDGPDAE